MVLYDKINKACYCSVSLFFPCRMHGSCLKAVYVGAATFGSMTEVPMITPLHPYVYRHVSSKILS